MKTIKTELNSLFPNLIWEEPNQYEIYLNIEAGNNDLFTQIIDYLVTKDLILINLFAAENFNKNNGITLFYVFEKRTSPDFLVLKLNTAGSIKSIANIFPAALWYEREISDGFGFNFTDSFDQRKLFLHEVYPEDFHPLKKDFINQPINIKEKIEPSDEYQFKKVHGEGVYQIPVGPVHAGIIEPGHFRFSVIGETICNLEIRMFWKHRGLEKLAEGKTPEDALKFAQAVSGDETVANTLACVNAIEKIAQIQIPLRAAHIRLIFAEMERIYALLGDLAGVILDAAYPAGASIFFILREEILRWNEKLSKSRFFKNSIKIGGVNVDLEVQVLDELWLYLKKFLTRFEIGLAQSISNYSVLDRLETTGIVKKELVDLLNFNGPLARASGIKVDVRVDHPYGLYNEIKPNVRTLETGDVLARVKIKAFTIKDSVNLIKKAIQHLPCGEIDTNYNLQDGFSLSAVESARGQNLCFVYLEGGKISRLKIRTASFCNWPAIEHAVIGNIVPDFPLINKSMNLSYAGTDL
ncbi:MAG: NADH-quinone oxidoreductase subunit C [Candidatus Margulisiibacteriota bacterium]|jgi:Ni,Fe-hydrogenase III large subunit/Ni,Fe-hydrogenase III component G